MGANESSLLGIITNSATTGTLRPHDTPMSVSTASTGVKWGFESVLAARSTAGHSSVGRLYDAEIEAYSDGPKKGRTMAIQVQWSR